MPPPARDDLDAGAYACDANGVAVLHLVGTDREIEGNDPVRSVALRGIVDPVALRCDSIEAYDDRLVRQGLEFSEMNVPQISIRLLFVRDPNGVLIELGAPFSPTVPIKV